MTFEATFVVGDEAPASTLPASLASRVNKPYPPRADAGCAAPIDSGTSRRRGLWAGINRGGNDDGWNVDRQPLHLGGRHHAAAQVTGRNSSQAAAAATDGAKPDGSDAVRGDRAGS